MRAGKEGPVTHSCPGGCCGRSGPTLCCPSSSLFIPLAIWVPLSLSLSPPVSFSLRPSPQSPHSLYLSLSLIFSLSLHVSVSLCLSPSLSWDLSESHICLSGSLTLGLLSRLIPFYLFQAQSVFISLHLSLPPSPCLFLFLLSH